MRVGRSAVIIATVLASLALPAVAQAADPVTTINSSIASTDPTQTNRLARNGVDSTCAAPNGAPGTIPTSGLHYKTFAISSLINETACLTFALNTPCTGASNIQGGVYNGSFDPVNI